MHVCQLSKRSFYSADDIDSKPFGAQPGIKFTNHIGLELVHKNGIYFFTSKAEQRHDIYNIRSDDQTPTL